MSKTVKLRKGLDIRLVGVANKVKTDSKVPSHVSVKPTDFHGTTPKMMVKEGDLVKAGDIIFYNKYNDKISFPNDIDFLEETLEDICHSGFNFISKPNKQEVVVIPKKTIKQGFFEKLFHLFR